MESLAEDKIYNEKEAAALLGMSARMLARRRRAGKIRHIKDGDFIAYRQTHLDEYCKRLERGLPGEEAPEPKTQLRPPQTVSRKRSRKLKTHRKAPDEGRMFIDLLTSEKSEREIPD